MVERDSEWQHNALWARRLAWVSLAVLLIEGGIGLWQGLAVRSVALTGWALAGGSEGLASAMVLWRFTGNRTLSQTAERRAQRGVAVSFWLTAPTSPRSPCTTWPAASTPKPRCWASR
ncbi:hypothetical protein BZL30_1563 [Mycobacterium kansasii]|uniref:Uncharacterized protein n=1 Tax=Mycobacterium kansasii TaxID=1768 RepID=A0A1V3XW81_MYCKA|nr:hypothetical protein BZL30_1563 [Mycobacterium kansasii]